MVQACIKAISGFRLDTENQLVYPTVSLGIAAVGFLRFCGGVSGNLEGIFRETIWRVSFTAETFKG